MQRRKAVGVAVKHVELVREFMDHDVDAVAVGARRDVGPRQDDRSLQPGLARARRSIGMHDTVLVDVFHRRHELVRIDDHLDPAGVVVDVEIEDQDARLRGDQQRHRGVEHEPAGAVHRLRVQEQNHGPAQTLALVVRQTGQKRQLFERAPPQRRIEIRALDDAAAAPAPERVEHAGSGGRTAGHLASPGPSAGAVAPLSSSTRSILAKRSLILRLLTCTSSTSLLACSMWRARLSMRD